MHAAVRVPHGVGILAQDKRLVRVLLEELLHVRRRRVHLRFHVGAVIVGAVVHDAFIMDKTGRVELPEFLGHPVDDKAAIALISAGPDQDRGMILVSLVA